MIHDFEHLKVVARQLEPHAGDATRGTAGVAEEDVAGLGVLLAEANGEALVRDEDELVGAGGEHAADDDVALVEVDADEAGLAGGVGVVGEGGLLDRAHLGRHDEVAVRRELGETDGGGDLLALVEREEGFNGFTLGGAHALGDLVNLFRETLAVTGNEEDGVVGGGGE